MDSAVKLEPGDSDSDFVTPSEHDRVAVQQNRRNTPSKPSPMTTTGKPPKRSKRKQPRDDEAEEASDDDLPMAGGDGSRGEGDLGFRHVMLPLWRETFDMTREEPVSPPRCFGCRHTKLGVMRLPFEQFNALASELPSMMIELGLYGACMWAGEQFSKNVLPAIDAPADIKRQIAWSGVGIVWHFCKHAYIAQFRLLIQIIELEDLYQRIVYSKLVAVPVFGSMDDACIDMATQKQLTSIALLLQRLRSSDPKKMLTYHPGVAAASASQMSGRVHREIFTGSNILHS